MTNSVLEKCSIHPSAVIHPVAHLEQPVRNGEAHGGGGEGFAHGIHNMRVFRRVRLEPALRAHRAAAHNGKALQPKLLFVYLVDKRLDGIAAYARALRRNMPQRCVFQLCHKDHPTFHYSTTILTQSKKKFNPRRRLIIFCNNFAAYP